MLMAVTAVMAGIGVLIVYAYQLTTTADATHTVKNRVPEISAEVARVSADLLDLDQAAAEQLHAALLANPPRVSCNETTSGHDTVFRSETTAQCFLSYNVREPVR